MSKRSCLYITVVALVVGIVGCPPSLDNLPRERAEPVAISIPETTAHAGIEWQPDTGRMSDDIARRHGFGSVRTVLWVDRFDRPDSPALAAWDRIGSPRVAPFQIGGESGVEIMSPMDAGECGLVRQVNPDKLGGRDVLLRVEMACPSPTRLDALRAVRLSIESTGADGETRELFLPVAADLTPGWERLGWWLRFGPQVGSAAVRLRFLQPGSGIVLRRVEMVGRDWSGATAADRTARQATTPEGEAAVNLIVGGGFETRRRIFHTSAYRDWPDGDRTFAPLPFELNDEAADGDRSLRVLVREGTARVGFGPLDLLCVAAARPDHVTWHLRFAARASHETRIHAAIHTAGGVAEQASFTVDDRWQTFTAAFRAPVRTLADEMSLSAAELVFEAPNTAWPEPLEVLLDAVSLTDAAADTFVPSEPIELGITGPAPLSADMANVVSEGEPAAFELDIVEHADATPPTAPASPPATTTQPTASAPSRTVGTLAIDVLDGWDRAVWSRTTDVTLATGGKRSERIVLPLPRGYYRMLATLWSGAPGASRRMSHDERSVAVVSFTDPVPLGNRFGLSTRDGCISGYTTALGAGWVRVELPSQRIETRPGIWQFAPWQEQVRAARQASVEIVAGLTLPAIGRYRRVFFEQWMAGNSVEPIGVVVGPPAISARPVDAYLEQLDWVGQLLAERSPQSQLVCDISALSGAAGEEPTPLPQTGNIVVGYSSADGAIPEKSERLLEQIGRAYTGDLRVWDLGVPVRLGSAAGLHDWEGLAAMTAGPLEPLMQLDAPTDPVLSASRMVRAILIRALAGAQLVCCDATALSPVESLFEPSGRRLHERDLTPKPAAVAFERMTSLLNDATLVRWIDQPDGCHILYFEKDDGGAVAALWRPFGQAPTTLIVPGLPADMPVIDCLGMPERAEMQGAIRLVPANEMVRYVLAPPGQAELLAEAIGAVRIHTAPPRTQPE